MDPQLRTEKEDEKIRIDFGSTEGDVLRVKRRLKREENRVDYRLHSIQQDSEFVKRVRQAYKDFPLIANLRCGLWYSPRFDAECYFKSTDGHVGTWAFPLSRLNLHVASLAADRGGVILIDSTRKGKEFPDSFTRTVPIWCCVLNGALSQWRSQRGIEGKGEWDSHLHMPMWVSSVEVAQIEEKIPTFVSSLLNSGALLDDLAKSLKKPMRCLWISRNSVLNNYEDEESGIDRWVDSLDFTPVLCVSASIPITDSSSAGYYVQGAGDDEESWALGLTPKMFWENRNLILESGRDNAEHIIEEILKRHQKQREANGEEGDSSSSADASGTSSSLKEILSRFRIGSSPIHLVHGSSLEDLARGGKTLWVLDLSEFPVEGKWVECENVLRMSIPQSNHDKRKIEKVLDKALKFGRKFTTAWREDRDLDLLICSQDGPDEIVVICVAFLVRFFEWHDTITLLPQEDGKSNGDLSKKDINSMLIKLASKYPDARPPRVLMKSLMRYFLSIY